MCHIKKFLYVHCPWRKGCENFDGKNIRIRSSKVFLSVSFKFGHKRVDPY